MRKDVLKGLVKIGLLAVVLVIAASASVKAQSLEYRLTANIPFDFTVSDKKLPAGEYQIVRGQPSNGDLVIQIRSKDGHEFVSRLTTPVITLDDVNKGTLVFHRYGDEYFLFEIWPAGGRTGRALPKSRAERDLQRKAEGPQQIVRVGL